jgi:alkanesulfonate monooxygenase SsuD/methylene tetrahydromethanopterin reductase-like flavin-dependent oxidoreductase (luciferase family)
VLCAEDATAARWLHGSSRLSLLRLRAGRPGTLPSPDEAAARSYSAAEQAVIAEATASHVVGDPATVAERLDQIVTDTGVDELMVTTSTFAHADRLASYELVGRAAGGPADQRASALAHRAAAVAPDQIGHAGRPGQTGDRAEGLG